MRFLHFAKFTGSYFRGVPIYEQMCDKLILELIQIPNSSATTNENFVSCDLCLDLLTQPEDPPFSKSKNLSPLESDLNLKTFISGVLTKDSLTALEQTNELVKGIESLGYEILNKDAGSIVNFFTEIKLDKARFAFERENFLNLILEVTRDFKPQVSAFITLVPYLNHEALLSGFRSLIYRIRVNLSPITLDFLSEFCHELKGRYKDFANK